MLSFFPLDALDEIWDVIESVSEGFLTYSSILEGLGCPGKQAGSHRCRIGSQAAWVHLHVFYHFFQGISDPLKKMVEKH